MNSNACQLTGSDQMEENKSSDLLRQNTEDDENDKNLFIFW